MNAARGGGAPGTHVRNAGWSVAETLASPLVLLLATPWLLRGLGTEGYGLWTLLVTLVSLGLVVGVGTGLAVVKLVAEVPRSDVAALNAVVQGATAVALRAGAAMAVLVAAAAAALSATALAPAGAPWRLVALGGVAALVLWAEQFDVVLAAVLKGREDYGVAARLEIVGRLAQAVGLVAVALATRQVLAVGLALLAATLLRTAAKAAWLHRHSPGLRLRPRRACAARLLQLSSWGWLQGLAAVLFGAADRLVVGAVLGPASLAHYGLGVQLASQLHALLASAFGVLTASISRRDDGPGARTRLRPSTLRLLLLNAAAAAAGALVLVTFGGAVLRAWVGEATAGQVAPVFGGLVFAYFVLSLSIVPYHVMVATGAVRTVAAVGIAGGVAVLALAGILVAAFGLHGAVLARLGYGVVALGLVIPALGYGRWSTAALPASSPPPPGAGPVPDATERMAPRPEVSPVSAVAFGGQPSPLPASAAVPGTRHVGRRGGG